MNTSMSSNAALPAAKDCERITNAPHTFTARNITPSFVNPNPLYNAAAFLELARQQAQQYSIPPNLFLSSEQEKSLAASMLLHRTLGRIDTNALMSLAYALTGTSQSSGQSAACWAVVSETSGTADLSAATAINPSSGSSIQFDGEQTDTADIWLYRFANAAPLVREASNCATVQALKNVDWGSFGLTISNVREPTQVRDNLAAPDAQSTLDLQHFTSTGGNTFGIGYI